MFALSKPETDAETNNLPKYVTVLFAVSLILNGVLPLMVPTKFSPSHRALHPKIP